MDKKNLSDIINNEDKSNNEDKPFLSLARLAEKFENQPPLAKTIEILLGLGVAGISVPSCTAGTVIPEPPGPVEELYYNVPYVAQPAGSGLCGVASSIMVLNYYGENLSMSTFGPTITTDEKLDVPKLHSYLMDNGYTLDFFKVSKFDGIDAIIDVLKRGPFMAEQKYSLTDDTKHIRVFIGYDNNKGEFTTHDPLRGKDFKIEYDDLFDISLNKQCWIFEIRPENKDTKSYQEKAIQLVNSQIDSILRKPEF